MGDKINFWLDNLLSVFWRILDLPLFVLLIALLLISMCISLLIQVFLKKFFSRNQDDYPKLISLFCAITLLLGFAFFADHRVKQIRQEINGIQEQKWNLNPNSSTQKKSLFPENFEQKIPFEIQQWKRTINETTELLVLKKSDPKAAIFISLTDLKHPSLEVVITPEKKEKFLTSTFAKSSSCFLAINGEAGETMYGGAPLGEWIGNWVSKGKPVFLKDGPIRPFIGFNSYNQAYYSKASEVDTILNDEKFNCIYGRFDLIVDGQIIDPFSPKPYSRTIMGINEKSQQLFLMVVDGKRQEYSLGLSYTEAAQILLALGCTQAMACDQGGSSCMYLEQSNSIINRPADSDGKERPVYSHFGLKLR